MPSFSHPIELALEGNLEKYTIYNSGTVICSTTLNNIDWVFLDEKNTRYATLSRYSPHTIQYRKLLRIVSDWLEETDQLYSMIFLTLSLRI